MSDVVIHMREVISIRLSKDEIDEIDELAREYNISRSAMIRLLLRVALANVWKLKELIAYEQVRGLMYGKEAQ